MEQMISHLSSSDFLHGLQAYKGTDARQAIAVLALVGALTLIYLVLCTVASLLGRLVFSRRHRAKTNAELRMTPSGRQAPTMAETMLSPKTTKSDRLVMPNEASTPCTHPLSQSAPPSAVSVASSGQ
eukprot:scaffold41014_cov40-Prasinocladus_malaysianus.AAC.1